MYRIITFGQIKNNVQKMFIECAFYCTLYEFRIYIMVIAL